MLELHALLHLFGLLSQPRFFLCGIFTLDLHVTQNPHSVALKVTQHLFEEIECFALVFLLGIFLRITAQMNTLTQVVHGCQMLFPQIIQYTQ